MIRSLTKSITIFCLFLTFGFVFHSHLHLDHDVQHQLDNRHDCVLCLSQSSMAVSDPFFFTAFDSCFTTGSVFIDTLFEYDRFSFLPPFRGPPEIAVS